MSSYDTEGRGGEGGEKSGGERKLIIWGTITWMDIMPKSGNFFFTFAQLFHWNPNTKDLQLKYQVQKNFMQSHNMP